VIINSKSNLSLERLLLVGVNHHSCPVDIRETLSFPSDRIDEALLSLKQNSEAVEALILSTCNRTELYTVGANRESLMAWLEGETKLNRTSLSPYIYQHNALKACEHIFRVASGLDSMVLGETQILGQIKNATRSSENVGLVGPILRELLDTSYTTAKLVRSNTNIGTNVISLPSAALKVARKIFGNLEGTSVLFVGAGEMIRLSAEYFSSAGTGTLTFTNRTSSKSYELAKRFDAETIAFEDISTRLSRYDVIVTCTSSSTPIFGESPVVKSLQDRKRKPMLFIDLAVPRDVDQKVADVSDIFLYAIDDLGEIVKNGSKDRELAAKEAVSYICDSVSKIDRSFKKKNIIPIIRAYRAESGRIAEEEMNRALQALSKHDDPKEVVRSLAKSIVVKLIHNPCHVLNNYDGDDLDTLVDALVLLHDIRPKL